MNYQTKTINWMVDNALSNGKISTVFNRANERTMGGIDALHDEIIVNILQRVSLGAFLLMSLITRRMRRLSLDSHVASAHLSYYMNGERSAYELYMFNKIGEFCTSGKHSMPVHYKVKLHGPQRIHTALIDLYRRSRGVF
jgi:hypothetical protein